MKNAFLFLAIVVMACSCGKKGESLTALPPEKSTTETAIDGFTGKTYVDAGKKAKKDIERASTKRNKDLDDALGD